MNLPLAVAWTVDDEGIVPEGISVTRDSGDNESGELYTDEFMFTYPSNASAFILPERYVSKRKELSTKPLSAPPANRKEQAEASAVETTPPAVATEHGNVPESFESDFKQEEEDEDDDDDEDEPEPVEESEDDLDWAELAPAKVAVNKAKNTVKEKSKKAAAGGKQNTMREEVLAVRKEVATKVRHTAVDHFMVDQCSL